MPKSLHLLHIFSFLLPFFYHRLIPFLNFATMRSKQLARHPDRGGFRTSPSQDSSQVLLASELGTPCAFLCPTPNIQLSTTDTAKYFLDSLAFDPNNSNSTNRHPNKKRKRSGVDKDSIDQALQLEQLYVEGFTPDQIWQQAIRILDATGKYVERDYIRSAEYTGNTGAIPADFTRTYDETRKAEINNSVSSIEGTTDESSISNSGEVEMESAGESEYSASRSPGSDNIGEPAGRITSTKGSHEKKHDSYTRDHYGLNDGFFSIDDFNRQSQFFEKRDAKGDSNGSESDDEEIDWHADPLGTDIGTSTENANSSKHLSDSDADNIMSDNSDEAGPTFDNSYLDGESGSDDHEATGYDDGNSGSAPPGSNYDDSHFKPDGSTLERDVHRAMADVRRDLFDDEASIEDEDVSNSALSDPKLRYSAHEKQRAKVADEIRRLEAANVSRKEWMLSGEARAAERPVNSLIEEDLDFERIGKSVPVPTNEVSEDIEELVKRRIVSKEFDEVIRRYPGAQDMREMRRGRFELDDTKPKRSLTELYESDHLRATDPNYIDPKNQKLVRVHNEITGLWNEISSQLDTLSNWHFKPKTPQADINVVTDMATIMMEDARPTAGGAQEGSAALAPQEIYTPGDGKVTGEFLLKSGVPIAKEEMTRDAKARLKRQLKKQKKSHGDPIKQQQGEGAEKQRLVSDLKRSGVKVIGNQGEITDIQGNKVGKQVQKGGDMLKL